MGLLRWSPRRRARLSTPGREWRYLPAFPAFPAANYCCYSNGPEYCQTRSRCARCLCVLRRNLRFLIESFSATPECGSSCAAARSCYGRTATTRPCRSSRLGVSKTPTRSASSRSAEALRRNERPCVSKLLASRFRACSAYLADPVPRADSVRPEHLAVLRELAAQR